MRCRPFPFSGRPFRGFGLLVVLALLAGTADAKRPKLEVEVQEAYMEIRTGPGRGFPRFGSGVYVAYLRVAEHSVVDADVVQVADESFACRDRT